VVVKATLPGIKRVDVDITITGDTLNVKGESKAEGKIKRENYLYREHRDGTFSPPLTLPGGFPHIEVWPASDRNRQAEPEPSPWSCVY